jgi:hypothetical protein
MLSTPREQGIGGIRSGPGLVKIILDYSIRYCRHAVALLISPTQTVGHTRGDPLLESCPQRAVGQLGRSAAYVGAV